MNWKLSRVCISAALLLTLSSCAAQPQKTQPGAGSGDVQSSPSSSSYGEQNIDERLNEFENMPVDPPYDFDPNEMQPKDFGAYFEEEYPECQVSTYPILEGTDYENTVTVLEGAEEGPVIYVIAGVHGDEQAAWHTGNLLKKIDIKAGKLYILAPANPWGAQADPPTRYVVGEEDLNRSFPGDPEGTPAQQVAAAIMEDVTKAEPDFVFDLHEAKVVNSQLDFLGSTLIFTDLTGMEDLFMSLVMETEAGNLCSEPFGIQGPGPEGSVNRTITETLQVPVITVETFRRYEMERRIGDQLAIVQYVLSYYGLVS